MFENVASVGKHLRRHKPHLGIVQMSAEEKETGYHQGSENRKQQRVLYIRIEN